MVLTRLNFKLLIQFSHDILILVLCRQLRQIVFKKLVKFDQLFFKLLIICNCNEFKLFLELKRLRFLLLSLLPFGTFGHFIFRRLVEFLKPLLFFLLLNYYNNGCNLVLKLKFLADEAQSLLEIIEVITLPDANVLIAVEICAFQTGDEWLVVSDFVVAIFEFANH